MPPNRTKPTDEEVLAAVRALQAGAGPDAFEVIFRRFFEPLRTFFVKRPSLQEEAEDLAQITLNRACRSIRQYRFEAGFAAWLRSIAEHVWINAVRERLAVKRAAPLDAQELPAGEGPEVKDPARNPEEMTLAEEKTRVLQQAVAALPPGMRTCTELRLYQDLEYHEIAAVTGIGLNSVRSQLFEARKRLKPVLEAYFQGADF